MVAQAHARFHLIDVLSTSAAAAEGVPRESGLLHHNLNRVVDQRGDKHRGERRHALALGVVGADAHQTMHAVLAFQVAVAVVALYLHRHRLDAGLIAFKQVRDGQFVLVVLRIAHIHTHQHLCPVLGFGAASARVDFQHTAHRVGFVAQHILKLQSLHNLNGGGILFVHFLFSGFAFLGKVEQHGQVVIGLGGFLIAIQPAFHLAYFLHRGFSGFGVAPKLWVLGLFV